MGGFSGGSRVALRIALGYPDLFHGVLLNAGSDPIGVADAPLPPADLFRIFQTSTRLVYLTGQQDAVNLNKDGGSQVSMRDWCVFNVDTLEIPRSGHEVADAATFHRALERFQKDLRVDPRKLEACRARIDEKMTVELRHVEDLAGAGKSRDALQSLERIDTRYGGLAAPRSLALAQKIATPGASKVKSPRRRRRDATNRGNEDEEEQ